MDRRGIFYAEKSVTAGPGATAAGSVRRRQQCSAGQFPGPWHRQGSWEHAAPGKTASISPRGASGWTLPARAMTGTPCSRASRATAAGALPMEVWKSKRPSPVKQRSLPGSSPVSPVFLQDDGSAGTQLGPQEGGKAEAQSAGGTGSRGHRGHSRERPWAAVSANRRRAASSRGIISGEAPFWGP